MKTKINGFTLTELCVGMSLSACLSLLLIKLVIWQNQLFQHISDQVFLDHHAVIAVRVMENAIKSSHQVYIAQNIIKTDKAIFYVESSKKSLYLKTDKFSVEFVPGVEVLKSNWIDNTHLQLEIHLIAPYGLQETFRKIVEIKHE